MILIYGLIQFNRTLRMKAIGLTYPLSQRGLYVRDPQNTSTDLHLPCRCDHISLYFEGNIVASEKEEAFWILGKYQL
jgi:hypothetical protein